MTSADLGGSQVCKDPYPHTYTAAGYEEARRCQLAAGHTGNHLWNSYSWEPTDPVGSGEMQLNAASRWEPKPPTDLGGSGSGSIDQNYEKWVQNLVVAHRETLKQVALLRADLEAARQQRMELFNQTRELKTDLEAARAENQRLKGNLERLLRKPDNSITMTLAEYDAMTDELAQAHAEIKRLKEERAEWESFHTAEIEMRGLIESHMDMSRSEWSCVQELAQAQARIAAQDKVIEAARRFRLARSDDAAAQAIRDLCAALDAAQEPSASQ